MDFDKLSVKEQLELKIFQCQCYIQEDEVLIKYFNSMVKYYNKQKDKDDLYKLIIAGYEDTLTMMNKRLSDYKESMYKLKDQLYNLKENE